MNKQFGLILGATVATMAFGSASFGDVLANWTFETSVPFLNDSTSYGPFAAEAGVFAASSMASGVHSSALTDWSNPVGNGTGESFSSNNWNIGDYYEFTTSTVGYDTISITWDQTRSGTGPQFFDLYWSTDGTNFTLLLDNYDVPAINWSSTTPDATLTTSFSAAGPAALDNQGTIWFRMTADSAAGGTAGSNRLDNVVISGNIPAPGALALLGVAGLVGRRRRRH